MAEEKSINVYDSVVSLLKVKLVKFCLFNKILSTCPIITSKWIGAMLIFHTILNWHDDEPYYYYSRFVAYSLPE